MTEQNTITQISIHNTKTPHTAATPITNIDHGEESVSGRSSCIDNMSSPIAISTSLSDSYTALYKSLPDSVVPSECT